MLLQKIILFFAILISFTSYCQTVELAGLSEKLRFSKDDTNKINAYHVNAKKWMRTQPLISLQFAKSGLQLSEKLNFEKGKVENELIIGEIYIHLGEYSKSLNHFYEIEHTLINTSNNSKIADVYISLSLIYLELEKKDLALKYALKAKCIYLRQKDNIGLANSYYSTGVIHKLKNEFATAKVNFETALVLFDKSKNLDKLPYILKEIALLDIQLKDFLSAQQNFSKALVIVKKNKDVIGQSSILNDIGDVHFQQKEYVSAANYYKRSLLFSEKYQLKNNEVHSYEKLATLFDVLNEYQKSIHYFKLYTLIKDSIFTVSNAKLLAEIEVKFENERQKRLLSISNAQIKKNNSQILLFRIGFVIFILLLLFFIYFLIDKTKINKIILLQKKEVETQNQIIEDKNKVVETQNKDIRDSIRYAERIQSAILPPKSFWSSILPNSFVFYRPKEVLSGDFHWIAETDTHIFVAAADCTGHGVPGAFISIVNYNLLNKAVLEKGMVDTALILDAVNTWLTESLHQTYEESSVKDGMDVSLISINKVSNEVYFSGAYHSIYLVRNDVLVEYKGDKFPVGVFIEDELNQFRSFKVDVQPGDMIYLFTDGFADQFGGPKGKKYKYAQLRDNLVAIGSKDMEEQSSQLMNNFDQWKGNLEQVDDVLILGIRF